MIKHPCGGAHVAIAEFIAAEHSVLAVSHFLESFRCAEACIYGYNNVVTPKHVVIDISLVLLLSFLRVYNFETVSDYLHQCFRVVKGCASKSVEEAFQRLSDKFSHLGETDVEFVTKAVNQLEDEDDLPIIPIVNQVTVNYKYASAVLKQLAIILCKLRKVIYVFDSCSNTLTH